MKEYLLAEDTITKDDLLDLIAWLSTNPRLTQGALVREFEAAYAQWLGVPYALFVNSGSSANLLMYAALLESGKLRNKRVVVPAVSWSTTVAPAIQLGFEPIMCDADPITFGLDLTQLETILRTHQPAAVIAVHVLGVPNEMKRLMELQKEYGFLLMEDSCAAMGSTFDGRKVGTFGTLSSFSFYYGHHASTIEGGMVCTADEELHDILLQLRSHGWAKDLAPHKEAAMAAKGSILEFNRPFTFYRAGFNVRSTDLNARIGLSQMKRFGHVVHRRMENHRTYQHLLGGTFLVQWNSSAEICSISFAALAKSSEHRDRIGQALRENHIETRPLGGGNMARQPFWTARFPVQALSTADLVHATSFQLPNHPGLLQEDIQHISEVVLGVA